MLHALADSLSELFSPFNILRYLTFRTGAATATALVTSFLAGPALIRLLRAFQTHGQPINADVPGHHLLTKRGTPTMGGLLILVSVTVSTVLWADILGNHLVWIALAVTLGFGLIGFCDDLAKIRRNSSGGVRAGHRFLAGCLIAAVAVWLLAGMSSPPFGNALAIPFFKDLFLPLGILFVPFGMLVIAGAANAVNLTDGLDGLAIGPVIIAAGSLAIISYLAGHAVFSRYLALPPVQGAGELAVFCGALAGAGLGFLWFNAHPASVFMGDTGSLSTGAALGVVAVATRHELVLFIIGGLFVLETASVIVQVISFRMTGRRIFRMAPLHHHFEKKGWSETTVVVRFWIIALLLALAGLSSLKLR